AKKSQERKQRGYREFKDYNPKKDKTFAKTKYSDSSTGDKKKDDIVSKWAKEAKAKQQDSGFKFPWDT
ncbi:MAG: hypothetical protein SGILL_003221, partial [Bacillariaceae sp.]